MKIREISVGALTVLVVLAGLVPAATAAPTYHERLLEVNDVVPEFGGHYLSDGETVINVQLTGDADQTKAEAAVEKLDAMFPDRPMRLGDLEIRPQAADFTWTELVGWRNAFVGETGGSHVVLYGISESRNRLWVGVVSREVYEPVIRDAATRVGVPVSALEVVETGPNVLHGDSRFGDVAEGSTHAAAIDWLAGWGVLGGFEDGTFRPGGELTRAQMASVLDRALPLPTGGDPGFRDVSLTSTHGRSIANLAAAGITDGTGDGTFGPTRPVTRGQLATFLDRALDLERGTDPGFDDVVAGSTHAQAIANLTESGIIDGFGDGTFRPAEPVTRGQISSLLRRALTDRDA